MSDDFSSIESEAGCCQCEGELLFVVREGKEGEEKIIDQRLINSNVVVPSSSEKEREG
jgi:hypothetical protein